MALQIFRRGLNMEDTPVELAQTGQTLAEALQDFIGIVDSRTMTPSVTNKSAAFTNILIEKASKMP